MVLHTAHLCSGYGGFELALRLTGVNSKTVVHVEKETYAAATLVARMEEKTLDFAPIWAELETFDGNPWRGSVDLITAGFPCQPWSSAGDQRGIEDDRWLWSDIARVIREMGPWLVFLENVPGLNRAKDGGGLPYILADLASLGFDAEWGVLGAGDVGAPHQRNRFWLLAVAHGHSERLQQEWGERFNACDTGGCCGAVMADPHRERCLSGNGSRQGSQGWQSHPEGHCSKDEQTKWPPARDDFDGWSQYSEANGPEPSVCRGSYGATVELADSLHLGGNGLVPAVAAYAFALLVERYTADPLISVNER